MAAPPEPPRSAARSATSPGRRYWPKSPPDSRDPNPRPVRFPLTQRKSPSIRGDATDEEPQRPRDQGTKGPKDQGTNGPPTSENRMGNDPRRKTALRECVPEA